MSIDPVDAVARGQHQAQGPFEQGGVALGLVEGVGGAGAGEVPAPGADDELGVLAADDGGEGAGPHRHRGQAEAVEGVGVHRHLTRGLQGTP